MPRLNWRFIIANIVLLTVGALISAIAIIVFMAPFQIAPAGVSGLAVILNHFNPALPIGLMVLIGNIPIQLLGFRTLGGWRVVASTIYYVVVYSLAIDLLSPYLSSVQVGDDALLNALFGGIIGGVGGGLVYRAGGTQGGTSTLGRILQYRFGFPLSTTSLYTDTLVIALAGIAFASWEAALYAMVALFAGALASDYVLEGPSVIRTATIVTDHPQEVAQAILGELGRGVTSWEGTGMFTEQPHTVLFVTVARPQVNTLRRLVFTVDPAAFVVIGQGHIAYGQGFKRVKPVL